MPYCNQCQLVHGEEHRFCQRCGQLLKGSKTTGARPCARCGAFIFPGQKFCTECGLPLRAARVVQEEEEAPDRPPLFYPRRAENVVRRRQRHPGRIISLILLLVVVVGGVYLWTQRPARPPSTQNPQVTAPQDDLHKEVEKIAEKIRAAHINKDINKWLSCYTSTYPNLGQLENTQLELWKNNDIKEISYRISNVQRVSEQEGTADIIWTIQLYNHSNHDYGLVRLGYKITVQKSQDGWRIKDSKEEAGGPS